MFDAIEDIPSQTLIEELLSRTPSNLAVALVEIADELTKIGTGQADINWLRDQSHIVTLAASIIQPYISPPKQLSERT
jgi:hypothetical protein